MSSIQRPILVFGATGRQGGSVAKALLESGWPVRAIVRDTTSSNAKALGNAGVELVQGSFADVEALRLAMRGTHGVYSVHPGSSGSGLPEDDEVRSGIAIADLAAEIGIEHLVYSSGASAGERLTGVARFDAKPRVEAHIRTLPIPATIVRPMIFMEMLTSPGFGLNEGKFTFFLRSDRSMQLVAVEDIGRFVAAIFNNKTRFAGVTLKLASDTVTGRSLEADFSEAAGYPIAYSRFSDEFLAANPELALIAESLANGPLADHVDLNIMREINPKILSFRSWLTGSGRKSLTDALRLKIEA